VNRAADRAHEMSDFQGCVLRPAIRSMY
jgi:hypothetical protein